MSLNPSGALNPQVVQSTTVVISGSFNVSYASFTDADATPDVSGGTFFKTANTGATSITNFDGATDALIFIKAGDNNTTIVHDVTKINLQGGIDVTMAQGDIMAFLADSGVWYEVSIR